MYYEPIKNERFFEMNRRYSEIDWTSFRDIIVAWERRIKGWYIEPVEVMLSRDANWLQRRIMSIIIRRPDPGHYAFSVMSTTCMLIDALSQYWFGVVSSEGKHFKDFVDACLPSYSGTLPTSVWHFEKKHAPNGKVLTKYSDVLWNGYRCGILHQAHTPLYCGVVPGKSGPRMELAGHAKYGSSAINVSLPGDRNCPVAVVEPEHLFDEVRSFLDRYLADLVNPDSAHDLIRQRFKVKFSDSFGVDIGTAAL
jgi:hypothetical protein